jgi:hypothetical protein
VGDFRMRPSPMAGCFHLGPFGIREAGAPMIDGCGVIHLDPDRRNAGPADVGHVVAAETWSGEDSSTPEIVVYNLVFPDVLALRRTLCLSGHRQQEISECRRLGEVDAQHRSFHQLARRGVVNDKMLSLQVQHSEV